MIGHLRWLSRPTPGVAPGSLAIAVYAEPDGYGGYECRAAQESGYEGVACLDDVARAAVLCCHIWRQTGREYAAVYAWSYLAFVLGMQEDDGRFINFIADWNGTRNRTGPTSFVGGGWWTTRALSALATGYATFHDPVHALAFQRGMRSMRTDCLSSGQAAQAILALLQFSYSASDADSLSIAADLAEEIITHRHGSALIDEAEEDPTHLWSRYHEIALMRAGLVLDRPSYITAAVDSAAAVLVPAALELGDRVPTLPAEAGCLARVLFCLSSTTGNRSHRRLAYRAAAWFFGHNAASVRMFDGPAERFYDGIDPGPARSRNAGAEANIEGALTLLDIWPMKILNGSYRANRG